MATCACWRRHRPPYILMSMKPWNLLTLRESRKKIRNWGSLFVFVFLRNSNCQETQAQPDGIYNEHSNPGNKHGGGRSDSRDGVRGEGEERDEKRCTEGLSAAGWEKRTACFLCKSCSVTKNRRKKNEGRMETHQRRSVCWLLSGTHETEAGAHLDLDGVFFLGGEDGVQVAAEPERTRQRRWRILRWRSGVKTCVLQSHPKSFFLEAVHSYGRTTAASAVASTLYTRNTSRCYCSLWTWTPLQKR